MTRLFLLVVDSSGIFELHFSAIFSVSFDPLSVVPNACSGLHHDYGYVSLNCDEELYHSYA